MRINLPTIIGILLLIIGIAAGVILVRSKEDIRNKAAEIKEQKFVICHKSVAQDNRWVQMEVAEHTLKSYLDGGDIYGNCPVLPNLPENADTTKGMFLADTVNIIDGSSKVSTISATPKTPKNETAEIQISTSLSGRDISKKGKDIPFRLVLRNGRTKMDVINSVNASGAADGIYTIKIKDLVPGTYEVLLKADGYLQIKFADVKLNKGINKFDWHDTAVIPGDFDGDNKVTGTDITAISSVITSEENGVVSGSEKIRYDVNADGVVTKDDLDIVFRSYSGSEVSGEN